MIRWCFALFIFNMPVGKATENTDRVCNSALGLEDGRIKDSQLSASSYYSNMYIYTGSIYLDTLARFGRLKNKYAWCADHHSSAPFFQIDFGEMVTVTGLATQGFRVNWRNYFVKTYTLKYSVDGSVWYDYSPPEKGLTGNNDSNLIQKNTLKPFQTRYLRIYPLSYSSLQCLRVEVYGCRLSEKATTQSPTTSAPSVAKVVGTKSVPKATVIRKTLHTSAKLATKATTVTITKSNPTTPIVNPVCNYAFGLEDGRIKDSQLSASSYVPNLYISGEGSINTEAKYGRLRNKFAWCANGRESQYFQVDFGGIVTVTGLATQGLENFMNDYYVKTYTLKFSFDGSDWSGYSPPPNKQWIGNYDGDTTQKNYFKKSVQTRYLRIYPQDYSIRRCLRVEVYGCRVKENGTFINTPDL